MDQIIWTKSYGPYDIGHMKQDHFIPDEIMDHVTWSTLNVHEHVRLYCAHLICDYLSNYVHFKNKLFFDEDSTIYHLFHQT